ncbi:neurofilament heavy polypeptide-like [Paramacrobiotus metropolitanus]|uniref:neurofilament heavy polypeptide-like n=1 Tax=Paramacrobiotus metropolitanus TaxID=2943436 RepID=UPI002445A505|nr:neurofilament heavy polypeptide-like [Paramacrobiotus metropolitanus]
MDTTSPSEERAETTVETSPQRDKPTSIHSGPRLTVDESRTNESADEPVNIPTKRSITKPKPPQDSSRELHDDPAFQHVKDLTRSEQDDCIDMAYPEDRELWHSLRLRRASIVGNTTKARRDPDRLTEKMADVMKRMGEHYRAEKSRPKALQLATPTRHKVTAPDPKSTKKTVQQPVVKMKVPSPTEQPSVQIEEDLDLRVINSANSTKSHKDKRKAKKEAAKPPAKPQPTETQKKPVKSEAKESTKPKSDSTVKTPKPNPAKRHKSSDDLDISDAGSQKAEQKEKAREPHDKEAVERKFKEVMERAGTKPTKTPASRPQKSSKPPTVD